MLFRSHSFLSFPVTIEGCLGQIWAELGLVIKKIADDGNLEMSVDEVFDAIKESIEWNTKKHKTEIVS